MLSKKGNNSPQSAGQSACYVAQYAAYLILCVNALRAHTQAGSHRKSLFSLFNRAATRAVSPEPGPMCWVGPPQMHTVLLPIVELYEVSVSLVLRLLKAPLV